MNSFYAILHRTPNKQGKPKEPWTQESERQDMKPVAHSKFFGQHEIRGLPLTRGHRKPTEKKKVSSSETPHVLLVWESPRVCHRIVFLPWIPDRRCLRIPTVHLDSVPTARSLDRSIKDSKHLLVEQR